MRVLIIGGAGFVGTNLRAKLRNQHEVTIFDKERTNPVNDSCTYIRGDICDYISLENAFKKCKPEQVFHLAGMVSRRECEETPTLAFQTNVVGAYNICNLSVKHRARLLYSGSSEEYGNMFSQCHVNESTPFGPATGIYSLTKRFAEEVIQHFSYEKGLDATVMRYFMLYGPGEPYNDYRSVIIRFVGKALRNEPLPVHVGTSRSWCYASDAVEAMELLLERFQPDCYEAYNIGKFDPIKTTDLAKMIAKMCDSKSTIVETPVEPTIISHKHASFDHIKDTIGWEARTSLIDGLHNVIEYERKKI